MPAYLTCGAIGFGAGLRWWRRCVRHGFGCLYFWLPWHIGIILGFLQDHCHQRHTDSCKCCEKPGHNIKPVWPRQVVEMWAGHPVRILSLHGKHKRINEDHGGCGRKHSKSDHWLTESSLVHLHPRLFIYFIGVLTHPQQYFTYMTVASLWEETGKSLEEKSWPSAGCWNTFPIIQGFENLFMKFS